MYYKQGNSSIKSAVYNQEGFQIKSGLYWCLYGNILYPFNGNLTTQIAIMPGSKADLRKLVCTTMMKTVRSNPCKMKLPHPCFSAKTSTTFQRWNNFLSTSLSNWVDIAPKIYNILFVISSHQTNNLDFPNFFTNFSQC